MGNRHAGMLMLLLVTLKAMEAQAGNLQLRPLCLSQYTLANRACAFLSTDERPHDSTASAEQDAQEMHGSNRTGNHEHMRNGEDEAQRRRHHHHHHHHHDKETEECCRWLKEVDSECVCDILRHLPPFLSRPDHSYTLHVEEDCTLVYSCGDDEHDD